MHEQQSSFPLIAICKDFPFTSPVCHHHLYWCLPSERNLPNSANNYNAIEQYAVTSYRLSPSLCKEYLFCIIGRDFLEVGTMFC